MSTIGSILRKSLFSAGELQPGEGRSATFSAIMLGLVLGAWYFIKPIRDEISAHQNNYLAYLTTATFVVMLIVAPIYAYLVKHATRRTLVPAVYWTFALLLTVFWALLRHGPSAWHVWIERAFFVVASVLNLFLVAVFWGLMADVFTQEQGKRSFGVIAAGGSLGSIIGPLLSSAVAKPPAALSWMKMASSTQLLISAAIFVVVPLLMTGIRATDQAHRARADEPIRGSTWSVLVAPFRSPYLLAVCGYMFLYALTSTFLYFQQSKILDAAISDRAARRAFLANMDFWVNVASFAVQLFLAAHAMRRLGVAFTLSITPVVTVAGFILLMFRPTLWPLAGVQVFRRIVNYGFARPSREVLFTVVPREDKYKAKAFIDTVIYRGGDTASGWIFELFQKMGLALGGISGVAAIISVGWVVLAWMLGRSHQRVAERAEPPKDVSPRGFEVKLAPR